MIRTFPETGMVVVLVYATTSTYTPVPLAPFVIKQMLIDILPTIQGFG
jgi:hypothetical protein